MYDFDKVNKFDTRKMLSGLKKIIISNNIESVLIYDYTAIEEIYLFSQMGITVYLNMKEELFPKLFPKQSKNIKPLTALKQKVDMIYIPSDKKMHSLDMDEQRSRLRKKGLVVYKTYNNALGENNSIVYQQVLPKSAVFTTISKNVVHKILFTQKGTYKFSLKKDKRVKPSEMKHILKTNGYKKVTSLGGDFQSEYDKSKDAIAIRIYKKVKLKDVFHSVDEEDMPLMTTDEISDRFNEVMEKNELTREDFELE